MRSGVVTALVIQLDYGGERRLVEIDAYSVESDLRNPALLREFSHESQLQSCIIRAAALIRSTELKIRINTRQK